MKLLLHLLAFILGMAFLIAGTIAGDGALIVCGCAILAAPYVLGRRDPPGPPGEDLRDAHGRGAA